MMLACDNIKQIEDSQKESSKETENVEKLKYDYEKSIDSLNKEIDTISKQKSELATDIKYAEAQIYTILQESYFDHVIIGTEDISLSKNFFSSILGFTIKEGRSHSNGIKNFFIEFKDNSELELITVINTKDEISKIYKSLIKQKKYGMQFALRTDKLNEIKRHFAVLNKNYDVIDENNTYAVLSKSEFDERLPLFFIQYKIQSFNSITDHPNQTNGISSIWFSTPKLRHTILDLADFGFLLVDTTKIEGISNKLALMKNDNFEIILMEDNNYKISGVTIRLDDLSKMRKRLDDNNVKYSAYRNEKGNNILLNPETTKSIWIEFTKSSNQ